jgi:transposase
MSKKDLFGVESCEGKKWAPDGSGAVRVQRAERNQVELRPSCLEDLLPEDHRARLLWSAVSRLDLSAFYGEVGSREGSAGRPAIDPKILIVLWLYATSEGVGSARELERLSTSHDAYRWICGGVSVNHHTLSDFRVGHGEALDALMTKILGVLMHEGILKLRRVAQDGVRVRAAAGAASFRRERSLRKCLKAAREQVQATKRLMSSEGGAATARERAARLQAAKEREARLTKALAQLEQVRESKGTEEEKAEARVSTTDPEARVMKMPDGGFRPAYNVQLATDTKSRVIVGVSVSNKGSDLGQMNPMLRQIKSRTGALPKEQLVDGGYVKLDDIEAAAQQNVAVLAPPQKPRTTKTPARRRTDGPGVAAWRRRMQTERGAEIYKQRAATAETVNADLRTWRGLGPVLVRGADKVLCLALWSAITYNLLRCISLGAIG